MEKWEGLETTIGKTLAEYISLDDAAFEAWLDAKPYEGKYKKLIKEYVKYFNEVT